MPFARKKARGPGLAHASSSAARRALRRTHAEHNPRAAGTLALVFCGLCVRPYLVENTVSRPICEVKQPQAWSVLRSGMTREPQVSHATRFFAQRPESACWHAPGGGEEQKHKAKIGKKEEALSGLSKNLVCVD